MFGVSGGMGCMYIKDCFTPNFPLLLIRLLRKLKLLIPMVGLHPPPNPTSPPRFISQVTSMIE